MWQQPVATTPQPKFQTGTRPARRAQTRDYLFLIPSDINGRDHPGMGKMRLPENHNPVTTKCAMEIRYTKLVSFLHLYFSC